MKIRIALVLAALTLGAACSTSDPGTLGGESPFGGVAADDTAPVASSLPSVSDFSASLVTTSSECFGSAGGLMTVEPEFDYTGPGLDSDGFQLIYEIEGGEDGPVLDNIRVGSNGSFNVGSEIIGTATCGDELTIAITDIR